MSRSLLVKTFATAAMAAATLLPERAGAAVFVEESRPNRPLVLEEGALVVYGGALTTIHGDPDLELGRIVQVPLGVAVGTSRNVELSARTHLQLHPRVATALTGRVRLGLGDVPLGVGLSFTAPLGLVTDRLGPDGIPVSFELPAFRIETPEAALLGAVHLDWLFQEAPDEKTLAMDLAAVLRINSAWFAVVETGARALDVDLGETRASVGLGLGWMSGEHSVIKFQGNALDLIDLAPWQIVLLWVGDWAAPDSTGDVWL